jgi:hypothetical protein
MDRTQLREELQQAYVLLRQQGHGKLKLPGGREIRAAAVDGTEVGRSASVLEILGGHAASVDLQPWEGKGKDLPSSELLLRRAFQRHGRGFADIVLGDGLYITEGMLRLCREELRTHLLVKTKEEGLLILRDAEAIFQGGKAMQRPPSAVDAAAATGDDGACYSFSFERSHEECHRLELLFVIGRFPVPAPCAHATKCDQRRYDHAIHFLFLLGAPAG